MFFTPECGQIPRVGPEGLIPQLDPGRLTDGHLQWGGCGGVCHCLAVGGLGWQCDGAVQHLLLVTQEVVELGYHYYLV